ncbi:MAG: anti-sigma factor antagonist [Angelakisella sp.]|jgi:stage II sporulation protein AA (anti-sigma F factor antagonist)|nr:anti-sigma factor antagonist [Angelakisella sp.]MCI9529936.1 anti-sigma factor antagonist [Angelakisella sp.]
MPVKIEIAPEADTVTAILSGEIDHHGAGRLREVIDDSVRRTCPRLLILDFGGVEFMDSSGIGIVLGRYRLMQDMGGRLALRSLPPHIRKVMQVAGISSLDIQEKGGKTQ